MATARYLLQLRLQQEERIAQQELCIDELLSAQRRIQDQLAEHPRDPGLALAFTETAESVRLALARREELGKTRLYLV